MKSKQSFITDIFKPKKVKQPLITDYFKPESKSMLLKSSKGCSSNRDYKFARLFFKKHRHHYDATMTRQGYFYGASGNFTHYSVYTTQDRYVQINDKKQFIPAGTLVATAIIDGDSALEHISVELSFRKQKIGTHLIRFINKCDTQFHVYAGIENNSRYRLTHEGAALIHACVRMNILKDDQVIEGTVPSSPFVGSPYR